MSKILVSLPCEARELESALHSFCDSHGAWDGKISVGRAGTSDGFRRYLAIEERGSEQ